MADPVTILGIGMKAVGWVASPIISELFKKCSTYLSFDASEKLRQLGPKVLLLERAMEVFEKIPDRSRLGQLFDDLKNAFYEAEDILDDIEYHCLEKKIQDGKVKSDGSPLKNKWGWVKKLLPKGSPLKDKATGMSKKDLKDSLEKIEDIVNNAYKFVEHLNLPNMSNFNGSQAAPANSGSAVTTGSPPPVVFGRDKERDKITEMLHEKEGDDQRNTNIGLCYSVIGIHGIGGSGKSTLAQLVYAREKEDQQEKKDDHFDLVMWVHVSQSFSVGDISKEIFEEATGNPCPQLNNLNTLQDRLEQKLHGKRFFLVLDDVWCNIRDERQQENLRQILSPLQAGEARSKILVTSRTEDALLVLGATKLRCIPISDLDDDVFHSLLMHYALEGAVVDDHIRRQLGMIGADIAKKLKGSPLSARIVGRRLGRRLDAEFWRTIQNAKFVAGAMGALWWSYQHLDQHVRRCFAYCSIFPRRHHLQRDELVELWVAEGFIRSSNEGEEMKDVGQEYFYELTSSSFLQLGGKGEDGKDYFLIHDLLHDLAGMVAGSDCFRIENGSDLRTEVWAGEVPRDVRHLYIHQYNRSLIIEKINELKSLRTLIIYNAGSDPAIEEVMEIIFKSLPKLRVLAINLPFDIDDMVSVPESVGLLKHLRYLRFWTKSSDFLVILPNTVAKLHHIKMLHSDGDIKLDSSSASFVNLRHISFNSGPSILNFGRLTSLQMIPSFRVRKEPGYEVKQLRDLNKLHGSLCINGLENIESKEEAIEANLAAKEWLTELTLSWEDHISEASVEIEAEVFEGLCPPIWLETLCISWYGGSRYPNWMVSNHNGGPKDLQELEFWTCGPPGPAPKLEGFIHLRSLWIWECCWDGLPSNMENLVSLKKLTINGCWNIRWLPTLPGSLEVFNLAGCNDEFMKSCETIGHPNWQKIEHVPKRNVEDPTDKEKMIRAYVRMLYINHKAGYFAR